MGKKHARFGPSTIDNKMVCCRFDYKPRDDDAGEEGTDLHTAFEEANLDLCENDEQRNAVEQVLGYARRFSKMQTFHEVRVVLRDLTYGHSDLVAIDAGARAIHAMDAKFTRVESAHGMQLATYASGMAAMMLEALEKGTMLELFADKEGELVKVGEVEPFLPDKLFTHVAAPRLGLFYEEEHLAIPFMEETIRKIEALYERIANPFTPPCATNEDLCRNCLWIADCPEARKVISGLGQELELPGINRMPIKLSSASPRDRGYMQALAQLAKAWGEATAKANAELAAAGAVFEGYKLMSRSTGSRIPAGQMSTAIDILVGSGICTRGDILQACSITPSSLASTVASRTGAPQGEARKRIEDSIRGILRSGKATFLQRSKRGVSAEELLAQFADEMSQDTQAAQLLEQFEDTEP